LISIPYQWLQTVTQNLREIKLQFHTSKKEYLEEFQEILVDLVEESKNP
jgi:hypothetical protein